ncbi:MAG: hypothetical protein V1835_04060 [Candidatus Micrarchaeota archaeon]
MKTYVPAIQLRGEVIYPGPKADHTPFKLKYGPDGKIAVALFAPPDPELHNAKRLLVMPGEGRAGVIPEKVRHIVELGGRAHFLETLGLKGIGLLIDIGGIKAYSIHPRIATFQDDLGVMSLRRAHQNLEIARQLSSMGVRTEIPEFIIRLHEIPVIKNKGEKPTILSINDARKHGLISGEAEPVIYGRGLGVPYRVNHLWLKGPNNEEKREMLRETFKFLNREEKYYAKKNKGAPATFNETDPHGYIEWFARTLARNLSNMHSKRMAHNNIRPFTSGFGGLAFEDPSNIWLDCRLADLGSVIVPGDAADFDKGKQKDLKDARALIGKFSSEVLKVFKGRRWLPGKYSSWEAYYGRLFDDVYAGKARKAESETGFSNLLRKIGLRK